MTIRPLRSAHLSNMDWNTVRHNNLTVPMSPKEDISTKWREIHGSSDWKKLLNPLDSSLRREIIKYGEFAQATYDAFDSDSLSEYCGSCRYNRQKLFGELGLCKNGYTVRNYIYAMSHVDMPEWLKRSDLVDDTWSKDSNWMGYVAVSNDEETRRIGRRDIVVAWRGTQTPTEWIKNLQCELVPIGDGDKDKDVEVEEGFHSIYNDKKESSRYNKTSASEQVMKEVTTLLELHRGEEVSLTITGHSLGGALALLNAYEAAKKLSPRPNLSISVISFGAPGVGNDSFKDKLKDMEVKTLRVVAKEDLVPRVPGIWIQECLQKIHDVVEDHQVHKMLELCFQGHKIFDEIEDCFYTHVGTKLIVEVGSSPYLKPGFNLAGFHSLETYLHLVDLLDGYHSDTSTFKLEARRDLALVNKARGMLVDELMIPESWYQLPYKGLVRNSAGRWLNPKRNTEDIPSPSSETPCTESSAGGM